MMLQPAGFLRADGWVIRGGGGVGIVAHAAFNEKHDIDIS
jgi:hypothetical protein